MQPLDEEVQFVAINRHKGLALDEDENIWTIRVWVNEHGRSCAPLEATWAIASLDISWAYLDLTHYNTLH
jgi:hypothetical protein